MSKDLNRVRRALADRYDVEYELGRGGMAAVYLADDLKHHRKVAIKVLEPELAASLGADRFLREIEMAAGLEHPHIIPVFDSGESDGLLFYVMPNVEGESLRQRLDRVGALPIERALKIGREVADGLAYAHDHGVVHRDIKPANVLLSDGHARIADFGVARAVDLEHTTKTGLVLGSPLYMSPEQAAGESVDGRSDIYSLGCVIYEMLAGEPPFSGSTAQALLARQMLDAPPSLPDVRTGIPTHIVGVVEKSLAKDPGQRFANAGELRSELEAASLSTHVGIGSERPRTISLDWLTGWRRVVAAGVVLLGLAALISELGGGRLGPEVAQSASVGPQQSFAIPGFQAASDDPEDQQLADKAAFELAVLLRGWDDVRVANRYRLREVGRYLELTLDGLTTIEGGLRVAREAGMGTLLLGELSTFGDSVRVVVYAYDVRSGEELQAGSLQATGPRAELARILSGIAKEVAALSVETDLSTFALQDLSTELEAIANWLQGQEELERWRLQNAERSFRLAIQTDTSFALPYHYLALTLSWQDDFNPRRRADHRAEILELTATSVRLANKTGVRLPWSERMRLTAFHALKHSDFDRARELYDSILAHNANDHEAWLQRGVVEYDDSGLVDVASEERPRKNLNLAVSAFRRAVDLRPAFQIGYGRLFDIYHIIPLYGAYGWCMGFEPAAGTASREVRDPRPEDQVFFCPVWLDSIEWLSVEDPDRVARKDEISRRAGARRDSSFRLLHEWVAVAPDVARPHVILSQLFEEERAAAARSWDRAGVEAASDSALRHLVEAASLTDRVLPEEMVHLGGLYLAVGDMESATELTERGLAAVDSLPGDSVSAVPQAANVFLAQGQLRRARAVVESYADPQTFSALDESRREVSFGGAETVMREIHLLGAIGLSSEELDAAFARLWSTWSRPVYTDADLAVLAANEATLRHLAPALVVHTAGRSEWLSRLDSVPRVWQALHAAREGKARAGDLVLTAAETSTNNSFWARDYYALGLAAGEAGHDSLAIALLGRLDAAAPSVRQTDALWSLRVLSYLWRAQAFERLGQRDSAVAYYTSFTDSWSNADPELDSRVEGAREAADRLAQTEN